MSFLRGLRSSDRPRFEGWGPWLDARLGDVLRDQKWQEARVASVASLLLTSEEDDPGDESRMTIVWISGRNEVEIAVVQRDTYGAGEPVAVEVFSDATPASLEPWGALSGALGGAWLETEVDGIGDVHVELFDHVADRAQGDRALACPSKGFAAFVYKAGGKDVSKHRLVLFDDAQQPRLALDVRRRRGGGGVR